MKPLDHALLLEATRLTRTGKLAEATALIRRGLGENVAAKSLAAGGPAAPAVDADVASDPASASSPAAIAARAHSPQAPDWTARLPGLRTPRHIQPADLAPSAGRYVSGTVSNAAGSRTYKLYVPSCAGVEPLPLIVMLHGCTQSADDFAAGTRMNFAGEEHGCFVVYPEQPQSANASKCWNWFRGGDQLRDAGEPSLIAAITRKIMADHRVDPRRVYVAGLSAGGAAAAIMGETYPDLYAAVGVHSGLACKLAHDLPSAFAAMQGKSSAADAGRGGGRPMPTIVFHGDRDTTVHPSNGATVLRRAAGDSDFRIMSERKLTAGGDRYSRTVQHDADGRGILELWELHGAAHAWSGGSPTGSFTSVNGPDATKEMVRFFLAHRRAAE